MSSIPLLLSIVITIFWGVTWFLTARASKKIDPVHSTFIFQLIGIPFLLPIAFYVHTGISFVLSAQIFFVGILLGIGLLFLFRAQKTGNISLVNPIAGTNSFVVVLLGLIVFREPLSLAKEAAIPLIFAGIILLSTDIKSLFKKSEVKLLAGVGSAICATLAGGIGLFIASFLTRSGHWFYTVVGVRSAVTLFTFLILIYKRQTIKSMFANVPWKFLLPAAILDSAAFSLYNFATSQYEVSYIAAFVASQSLIGVILAHIFLKERLSPLQYVGLPLAIGGLVLLNLK